MMAKIRSGVLTFPDTGPENVAIIGVHHDPLSVERIFVYGTVNEKLADMKPDVGAPLT